MFENFTEKQLIALYAFISIVFAVGTFFYYYFSGLNAYYGVVAANVIFFCMFYVLYLPLKVKRAREKREKEKKKNKKK